MKKSLLTISFAALLLSCNQSNWNNEYIGKYGNKNNELVYVDTLNGKMFFRPVFWRSRQILEAAGKDSFLVADRHDRQAVFLRDGKNEITELRVNGINFSDKLYKQDENIHLPVEQLFTSNAETAVNKMIENKVPVDAMIRIGDQLFNKFPSRYKETELFFKALSQNFPGNFTINLFLGKAAIANANRKLAAESFLNAYKLNKNDMELQQYMAELKLGEIKIDGVKLPFTLDEVFAPVTEKEINQVKDYWKGLNLDPERATVVFQDTLDLGYHKSIIKILSHNVLGDVHYGALISPLNQSTGKLPAIVELKGVSWNFPPRILDEGCLASEILQEDQNKFIYIIPAYRGEKLIYKDRVFKSGGDSLNSFSGTPADGLALLNVALMVENQIDTSKIISFGLSRGGSVALLTAERDKRIKFVVDWTGPVDWFKLMGQQGWSQKELADIGLKFRSEPNEIGGQFIRRFFSKAIRRTETLSDVRMKMIAGSPLYFVEQLPNYVQIHYGIEDEIVPIINGKTLERRFVETHSNISHFKSFYYENAGHDLDKEQAFANTKSFFMQVLEK